MLERQFSDANDVLLVRLWQFSATEGSVQILPIANCRLAFHQFEPISSAPTSARQLHAGLPNDLDGVYFKGQPGWRPKTKATGKSAPVALLSQNV